MGNPFSREQVREEKRGEIVRVAGELFCAQGFARVSMEDISNALKLSKTIVYYYFDSKQAVFAACHLVATELMERALSEAGDDDPVSSLRRFVRLYAEFLAGDKSPGAVLLDVELLSEPDRTGIESRRARVHECVQELVRRAQNATGGRDIDPKLAVIGIMSCLNMIPKWYRSVGEWAPAEVGRAYAELLVAGLVRSDTPVDVG